MVIFWSSSDRRHHLSGSTVYRQMGEERGSLRGQEKTPDMPGHHYSTGKLIYLFCFTSFFRRRYAFCLHPSEQVFESRRVAVYSSPQTSHTLLRSSALFSLRIWFWYARRQGSEHKVRRSSESFRRETIGRSQCAQSCVTTSSLCGDNQSGAQAPHSTVRS